VLLEIIEDIKKSLTESNHSHQVIKLEKRLARLTAKIAVVKVGANSEIELKEKADRIEDAICATKAAIKEGIVPGGGIALLNASHNIDTFSVGEEILLDSIRAPFKTILDNAGIDYAPLETISKIGYGLNVITGETVDMIKAGIIDPLLVTKSALRNAASVATTILSTDCVINNLRVS
jgi:chaperonin GroEL